MNLLCLETSSGLCSVALETRESALIRRDSETPQSHSNLINSMIEEVCEEGTIRLKDIDAIVVSAGPGSYTGLRIGASVASGIAYGLEKPLVAIPSLRAMCVGLLAQGTSMSGDTLLCPMIDARRMEVFTAVYNNLGQEVTAPSAMVVDQDSFKERLDKNRMIFFGSGAEKVAAVIQHENAVFHCQGFLSATHLLAPAKERIALEQFEDLAYWTPFYLKKHQTGAHRSKKSLFERK